MKPMALWIVLLFVSICPAIAQKDYHEPYRPQVHFSPKQYWINDPNGLVYAKGIYHLFFQYTPGTSVPGPRSWGHATSTDLVHWKQHPIAIYPGKLGYIYSGSAVVDSNNTSGFGMNGKPPLIAVYANNDTAGEHAHTNTYQYQSIAYSNDGGETWTKYAGNPVLPNPGITDFRDPSVMWFAPDSEWIMTLATKDRLTFYSSKNLKSWNKESEFGQSAGAHGGVWECPDLFPMHDSGKIVWVLLTSVGSKAPNDGSGTQYFLGNFDGHQFTPYDSTIRWIDYGPDDYAGITWNNTGSKKIFLGWMSNWLYAKKVPTIKWRNAMTFPRDLKIKHVDGTMYVTSEPMKDIQSIEEKAVVLKNIRINKLFDLGTQTGQIHFPCRIDMSEDVQDFSLTLTNLLNEKLIIGYDSGKNEYYIDRTHAGKSSFYQGFAKIETAPRLCNTMLQNISLIIDESSVELFADEGLTVMTAIFFPNRPYNKIRLKGNKDGKIKELKYIPLKSIWP